MKVKSKKTLLMVEDEFLIAAAKKAELEKYGYKVILTNTGKKAVAFIKENKGIDLILMDIDLGNGIDGTIAAEMILKELDIPILFISSHTEPEVVEKTEKITSYGYVVKNSSITVLDASIKMAFKLFNSHIKIEEGKLLLQKTIDGIAEPILQIDKDYRVISSNMAVKESYHADKEYCYQISHNSNIPCKDEDHPCVLQEVIKTKKLAKSIHKHINKNGMERFAELTATPVFDNKNNVISVIEILYDITDRLHLAEIKNEYTANLNSLINNRKESIWSIDRNFNYIILNDFYKETYYTVYNIELNKGMNALKALPSEQIEVWKSKYESALKGESVIFEFINPIDHFFEVSLNPIVTNKEITGVTALSIDITRRKQTELLLNNTVLRMDGIIEGTNVGTWEWNVQTGETMFNTRWAQILGYTLDELSPVSIKTWKALTHPEDLKKSEILLNRHFSGGIPYYNFESRMKHKNGHWIWVLDRGKVNTWTKDGEPLMMFGTHLDITESKMAEVLLKQTHTNYETFFNAIDDFLFVLDEQGNIIHTNSTVNDRLGYSREELSGKSILMVHPPEYRVEAGRIVGKMLSGLMDFCPVPVMSKMGLQIPVETRVFPGIWDSKPVIFGVTKDISRVQLSEEKFSKLFHLNPSACGLSSLDDHTYLEVNEAFYTLFGFEKSEVIGKTASALGILDQGAINTIMSEADGEGNVTNIEADLKAKNGDIKHVIISSENIYVQDKRYRFTVVNNITERKLAEDKIKSLLAEKEIILKEVHHRIKNNMNTLIGLLSLQANTLDDKLSKLALGDAEGRIRSMMVLYEKLYLSDNYNDIKVKEYLPSLIGEVINNFPNSSTVNFDIVVDDFILDVKIIQTLGIIINELLTNIMKYAFSGRDFGLIEIELKEEKGELTLTIQDDGIGLPEGFSIDNTKGFGLKLIKMLNKQLDGSFTIEDNPGTRCTLKFPV
jgi:PAS domain S-box-containing protein